MAFGSATGDWRETMRDFVQKQNQLQQRAFYNLARSNAATSELTDHRHPILTLQQPIDNQARQRLLRTDAEELNVGPTRTVTTPRFVHDFGRIPIYAKMSRTIQPKLRVST